MYNISGWFAISCKCWGTSELNDTAQVEWRLVHVCQGNVSFFFSVFTSLGQNKNTRTTLLHGRFCFNIMCILCTKIGHTNSEIIFEGSSGRTYHEMGKSSPKAHKLPGPRDEGLWQQFKGTRRTEANIYWNTLRKITVNDPTSLWTGIPFCIFYAYWHLLTRPFSQFFVLM